jgi:hypothetical protein
MEKNVMRSMELVSRERMEVAVSPPVYLELWSPALMSTSNNYPFGAQHVTMTFLMLLISWVS